MRTVIFSCFTPYQLLNAVYYGEKLKKKAKRILIWHNYTKYNIDLYRFEMAFDEVCSINNFYTESFLPRQFHKCLYGGWLFKFSSIYKIISKMTGNDTLLLIFSDQHIVSRKILTSFANKAKDVVLIEEGMATYLIRSREIPKSKDWFINLFLGARYEPYIGANHNIRTIFVKHPNMLPEEKKQNRTIIQQNNVFRDRIWGELFQDVLPYLNSIGEHRKKIILWLGQPLEMDGVSLEAQISWLQNVGNAIPEDYTLLIKPHPREEVNKYNSLLNSKNIKQMNFGKINWIPIEILASLIRPDVVLTAFSTAANNILELGLQCKVVYCYSTFGLFMGDKVVGHLETDANIYNIKNVAELCDVLGLSIKEGQTMLFENQDADINYLQGI